MGTINNIYLLAKSLMQLKAGQVMQIATSPEENCGEEYAATLIDLFGAQVIYINVPDGGGYPFVKDISVFYEDKTVRELAEELDEYLINGSIMGDH